MMIEYLMNQNDLKQIGELIDLKFDARFEKLEGNLSNWRSEIMNSIDVLAKEISDEREFRRIASHQITSNTRRIESVEKKVFGLVQSDG